VIDFGIVKVTRGQPPSRGGKKTLTVQLPKALVDSWPVWATHVRVLVDADGMHLLPLRAPTDPPQPVPAELPWADPLPEGASP